MGTMLMTRRTPRITYRIGMRARVGVLEDELLPACRSEAPSIEVAAEFTSIYRILMWIGWLAGKNHATPHYESVSKNPRLTRIWQENEMACSSRFKCFHSFPGGSSIQKSRPVAPCLRARWHTSAR